MANRIAALKEPQADHHANHLRACQLVKLKIDSTNEKQFLVNTRLSSVRLAERPPLDVTTKVEQKQILHCRLLPITRAGVAAGVVEARTWLLTNKDTALYSVCRQLVDIKRCRAW
jgi:hypothetical protein